jgi:raffinose/stachyose/melibiose transport system permease protein
VAYLYILPGFLVFTLFVLVPLVHAVWLSFFDWDGVSVGKWTGLENYRQVFTDPEIRSSFAHSGVLILFYVALPVTLGLALAALMARVRVRGLAVYRTALFLPTIISTVVVGVIWRWIYEPDGPLNAILGTSRAWLGDFNWALAAVGLIGSWVTTGLCMVLFLAGLQQIPQSLYDAARVDGAGALREFFAVTLPGLRNVLAVALTLCVIGALRSFDIIYVTTVGGPGNATTVPGLLIYQDAFSLGRVGQAAAIAVVLTILIFVVTFAVTRIAEREGH